MSYYKLIYALGGLNEHENIECDNHFDSEDEAYDWAEQNLSMDHDYMAVKTYNDWE